MDPNANLREQSEILAELAPTVGPVPRERSERLRELRKALRHWLGMSGFAPDWTAYPHAAQSFKRWAGFPVAHPVHQITAWRGNSADEMPLCGADKDAPDVWGYRTTDARFVTCAACKVAQ